MLSNFNQGQYTPLASLLLLLFQHPLHGLPVFAFFSYPKKLFVPHLFCFWSQLWSVIHFGRFSSICFPAVLLHTGLCPSSSLINLQASQPCGYQTRHLLLHPLLMIPEIYTNFPSFSFRFKSVIKIPLLLFTFWKFRVSSLEFDAPHSYTTWTSACTFCF